MARWNYLFGSKIKIENGFALNLKVTIKIGEKSSIFILGVDSMKRLGYN